MDVNTNIKERSVEDETRQLSSDIVNNLTYSSDTNGRVSYGRIGRIVFVSVYNALSSTDFTFLPTPVAYTSLVFWGGSGTYKGYVEYSASWVNHITVDGCYGSFCYIAAS